MALLMEHFVLEQNARPSSALCPGHPAQGWTHCGLPVCLWNERTRADASQQRARGWGSADLGLIPAPHTTTLNSPFTSAGFLLPLTQWRRHLVSLQPRIGRKLRLALGPQKHFEKNPFLLFMLIISHLFTYVQIFPTFRVFLIFIQKKFVFN